MARVDKRAAELGRHCSRHVWALTDPDLQQRTGLNPHGFGFEDLIGGFNTGQGTADNATVRRVARPRLLRHREKNR